MFDPIGGFSRMIEQFLAYLDTAYRIDDSRVSAMRRELLSQPGQLALDPILEAVPRYETAGHGLETLIDDPGKKLPGFTRPQREAFVELALSGLFERDKESAEIKGEYEPYLHQMQMLSKGVSDGKPGIVTSGTGSGKTESFMLPILAQLAKEATTWPAPLKPVDDDWLEKGKEFQLHRRNEHPETLEGRDANRGGGRAKKTIAKLPAKLAFEVAPIIWGEGPTGPATEQPLPPTSRKDVPASFDVEFRDFLS